MRHKGRVLVSALLIAMGLIAPALWRVNKARFLAQANLGDGRILRVEAVTFGKEHQAGRDSLILRTIGPWLSDGVREFFEPAAPRNRIGMEEDGLVVWVNAVAADSGTNVDCQGIRLDLIGKDGTTFSDGQPHWFGGTKFWRVGHVFEAFPRNSRYLKMRVTPWRGGNSVEVAFRNPGYFEGRTWTGEPMPVRHASGGAEVVLAGLKLATNKSEYWQSSSTWWEPNFEIWWNGSRQTNGWDLEWRAEDRYGNRGKHLGVAEPVLRFKAALHPSPTNKHAPISITKLPMTEIPTGTNVVRWNISAPLKGNQVTVLGLFPAGVHTFSEGEYLTNPPVMFAPVVGGAPSGWVSSSRRVTPTRSESFEGHYSKVPVIYARVSNTKTDDRIGVRFMDKRGRVFLAEAEEQGSRGGIVPFLLRAPSDVTEVQAELVFLPSFRAEFLVQTPAKSK